ncbi:Uu.00g009040.m01.CDS01 [Anthostomella pinea]|uniref:Uu.00g009040.m01.CDS01 n=1 Tax=Anthostomella pinea TaxID=933095 RepID=A0AAI8YPZ2_9PEZI|nr:Uu.00g009040.m01.CDS01 [Anthostomella pinea]
MSIAEVPRSYAARTQDALARKFPNWKPSRDSTVASERATRTGASSEIIVHHDELLEFFLSCNWILRPEGLNDFYAALHQELTNPEITYDAGYGGFRIRCPTQSEEKMVEIAQQVMDRIVRQELAKDEPDKIMHIAEWRAKGGFSGIDETEKRQYEKYAFPLQVAACEQRGKWTLPDHLVKEGMSTRTMLPGNALANIQGLTGSLALMSYDGTTVYIGAPTQEAVAVVLNKLDTIAHYFSLPQGSEGKFECFLYAEGGSGVEGEFRYLYHADRKSLRTYFLDRTSKLPYKRLFEKATVVKLLPSFPQGPASAASLPQKPRDVGEATQPYKAFLGWQYRHKERVMEEEPPPQAHSPSFQAKTNPLVETWVELLPQVYANSTLTDVAKSTFTGAQQGSLMPASKNRKTGGSVKPSTSTSHATEANGKSPEVKQRPSGTTDFSRVEPTSRETNPTPDEACSHPGKQKNMPSHYQLTQHRQQPDSGSVASTNSSSEAPAGRGWVLPRPTPFTNPLWGRSTAEGFAQKDHRLSLGTSVSKEPEDSAREDRNRILATEVANFNKNFARVAAGTADSDKKHSGMPRTYASAVQIGRKHTHTSLTNDPFANLWKGARSASIPSFGTPKPTRKATHKANDSLIELSPARVQPKLLRDDERSSRSFYDTMRQTAGSRRMGDNKIQDPEPQLMQTMNEKLVRLMSVLRMFPGDISLKAELGRFCFTKIDPSYVQLPNQSTRGRQHALSVLEGSINRQHTNAKQVLFTKILSTHGGDANLIAQLTEPNAQPESEPTRMWSPLPDSRRTVYEIPCESITKSGLPFPFIIDVNGDDFTFRIRQALPDNHSLAVHCTKRVWDFRLLLSSSQNLEKIYGNFARDLVRSLRVLPQRGGIPVLQLLNNRAYNVIIGLVRTRNIASYSRAVSRNQTNILEISEVWDMQMAAPVETEDGVELTFDEFRGNKQSGHAATWYEATIQSKMVSEALCENRDLEFGDEASWTAEKFQESGAFDELIRTTTDVVKRIDSVGQWEDNYQDAMIHPMPPETRSGEINLPSEAKNHQFQYW